MSVFCQYNVVTRSSHAHAAVHKKRTVTRPASGVAVSCVHTRVLCQGVQLSIPANRSPIVQGVQLSTSYKRQARIPCSLHTVYVCTLSPVQGVLRGNASTLRFVSFAVLLSLRYPSLSVRDSFL